MKIKDDVHVDVDDFYYNLFDGGYINPEELLENEEDITRVKEAILTIIEFETALEDAEAISFI